MNNIILTGFMGCGKSTLGIRLSYRFKMPYLDTDKLIEKETGLTITEIFELYGEPRFREMETECIRSLNTDNSGNIISVGGGLPITPGNGELLKELGAVIYLKISPEGVYERLKDDQTRPLLRSEDPLKKIRELMEIREEIYRSQADFIIEVENKSFEEIMKEIQEVLGKNETTCD